MNHHKPVVLSLLAHPDDAEILCAGTLLRLISAGWEGHIATFTPGDCGSMELSPEAISRVRRGEALAAARHAGARYHCLEERDLLLFYAPEPLRKTVALLRSVRPDIVLAHSPADYMPDHEVASLLVRLAGDSVVERYGVTPVLRIGAVIACGGLVVVTAAPTWPVAVLGFTLTGAGISAESGIPTFRGAGGLWRNFRPEELATPTAFIRDPQTVWEWYYWRRALIAKALRAPETDRTVQKQFATVGCSTSH